MEAKQRIVAPASEVYGLLIGGRFRASSESMSFASLEPATGQTLASVSLATARDVDLAISAARQAFDKGPWPRMRPAERAFYLCQIADLLEERLEALAELESRDTGLPILFTQQGHLPRAVAHFRYFAAEGERLIGEVYQMEDAYFNLVIREPVGVAAIITPWNAPLSVASMQVAAALACGNTCVLKPSELSPLSSHALAEIALEVGLPDGVLNVIQGPGRPTGQALVTHPGVDLINFTGGTVTGERVMAAAAQGIRRVGLELGGKSANLIFADADFDRALDGALLSLFANNGEACHAGSRLLIEEKIAEEFAAEFARRAERLRVGDPLSPITEIGPLISHEHQAKVLEFIASGLAEGAVLRAGGQAAQKPLSAGFYVPPTVFSGVNNEMRIAREEIFGPVAAIIPFSHEDEAIALANASPYGLAGYVWTSQAERGLRVASRLRAGAVSINAPAVRDIRAPFGGYKQSGLGRTGGRFSVDHYTELKTVCLPVHGYEFPRLGGEG